MKFFLESAGGARNRLGTWTRPEVSGLSFGVVYASRFSPFLRTAVLSMVLYSGFKQESGISIPE